MGLPPRSDRKVKTSDIELVCFTGDSGLTDYSVSLARVMAQSRNVRLLTSNRFPPRFLGLGFGVLYPFRRVRHYPVDIFRLFWHFLSAPRGNILFQSWLVSPFVEAFVVRAAKVLGFATFITVHDTLPHHPAPWSKWEMGFFYRSFTGLIAHSDKSMEDLRRLGVKAPIEVIPHGTHDMFCTREVSKDLARTELGLPAAKYVFLQFGHIDNRKGCFEFLETARRCADLSNVHFVIAGRNDLAGSEQHILDRYRGMPNLTIKEGHVAFDDVQLYFRAADLVAAPYREGTTCGVYRLALAFGLPVVAAEVGDLTEAIARGTAISIGAGDEVVRRFEKFVRDYAVAGDSLVRGSVDLMRREAARLDWRVVAPSYMDFIATVSAQRA
jgi:glycosyltransferase involved in cell wall biosynthesis